MFHPYFIELRLAQVKLRSKSSQCFPYGSSVCWSFGYVVTTAASTSIAGVDFVVIMHITPIELVRSERSFIPSFADHSFMVATV